jgi:trimeric autotransporter adhesin
LLADENAAVPFGSPGEKAWYNAHKAELADANNRVAAAELAIQQRTGVNVKELANREALAAGRAPTYPTTTIGSSSASTTTSSPRGATASTYRPPSRSSGGGKSTGTARSGSGTSSASSANTFFTEYKALTKGTPEYKAAVADPTVRDLLSASAAKTATPAMYDAATTALRDAVAKARSGGATGSNGVTAPAGSEAATIAAGPGATAASKDAYYTALVRASMDKAGERLYGTSLPNLSHAQALALFNAVQAGGNSGYTPGAGTKAAVTGYSAPTKATTATGYVPYTAAQRAAYGTQFTRAQKAAYGASKKGVAA